jgi:hypothetical protein
LPQGDREQGVLGCGPAEAYFDQLAKALLLKSGALKEVEVRIGHLTTPKLVELLKRDGLMVDGHDAARHLGERGNTIMQKGLYEERVLPGLILDSIRDLLTVSVAPAEKVVSGPPTAVLPVVAVRAHCRQLATSGPLQRSRPSKCALSGRREHVQARQEGYWPHSSFPSRTRSQQE